MKISFDQAIERLDQARLVAIPTETVYGLAARIDRPPAVEAIFATKKRPKSNPLIVHVASVQALEDLVDFSAPKTLELIEHFWPGPLTLILPLKRALYEGITAGLSTLAVRMPSHPLCLKLLEKSGPLVAPSANLSGRPSPSSAQHVESDYGDEVPVLDGGVCTKGVESTILVWQRLEESPARGGSWQIARPGALCAEDFEGVLGYRPPLHASVDRTSHQAPICPGQRFRHYAPLARLLVLENLTPEGKTIVGFCDRHYEGALSVYELGCSGDLQGCLHNLYATLRQLDADGVHQVWVDMNFDIKAHGRTLYERLHKASGGAC